MVCVRVCVMCARAVLGVSGAYPIYLSVHILSTPYPCIYTDQPLRAHQHVLVHHLERVAGHPHAPHRSPRGRTPF